MVIITYYYYYVVVVVENGCHEEIRNPKAAESSTTSFNF
jgi:hypothetical protein